ncbi:nucleotidyl transferase AbiEii/AbiGii toxin family protein [Bradyrhizobium barranii]|uniref:nucleotidyl transferase AbiEii/AbiGii toxin family protein n=1 Tax=Bradyrhizobium TaxID=374 RepID=UPI0024B09515|nr:nucleotidyl transferase AbiEii/AbiGii toxin family protein [Bradyrhizobium barranii]WFT96722.1 nucleotidyl transferase AbiEii/AbiGii toxin family protein [Bradyrhizobium barranii]
MDVIDNRAKAVPCYDPGYTFVEKLQTISTKFRKQQADGSDPVGFMRHYYDIYELLKQPDVQKFIGTDPYKTHKQARFRKDDNQNIAENDAFILSDATTRARYADAYDRSSALYYAGKPTLGQILAEIKTSIDRL